MAKVVEECCSADESIDNNKDLPVKTKIKESARSELILYVVGAPAAVLVPRI